MRKAVLILGLIGASFAGGVLFNGPAQAWTRTWMQKAGAARPEAATAPPVEPVADLGGFPSAPLPTPTTSTSESLRLPPLAPPAPAEVPAPPVPSSPLPKLEPSPAPAQDEPTIVPPAPERMADQPRRDPAVARAVEAPAPGASGGWTDLRRRLAEAGIRRYWVEGDPAGAVRFRCVIPLAGERAVGQQFEAEGDDEIQAAQATLKRIALWKAVEGR